MLIFVSRIAFIITFLHPELNIIAQDEKIYTVSEVNTKPEPEKGLDNFADTWSKSVVYPAEAITNNIQGTVFIQFIVKEDGRITEASVKSGIGHGCDEAALTGFLEVIKKAWKPAIKNNRFVKVKMVMPFVFRITQIKK